MNILERLRIRVCYDGEGTGGGGSGGSSGAPAGATPSASAPSGESSSPASSSPSPSPAPADAKPAAPAPLPEDAFAGFDSASDDDGNDTPVVTPAAASPAAVVPPAQEPPVAPVQPPAPNPAEPQQPSVAQPPGPQGAAPQLPTPAEPAKIGAALLADIGPLSDHLATTPEFALSQADIEAIDSDVHTAIPKLMARTFIRAQAAAMNQMERVVPAIIERYNAAIKAREKSEGKFYARWPDVKKDAHGEVVDRLAAAYRRMNPSATLEQMVEEVGPMVMMTAKITPGQQQAQQPGANGAQQPPARRMPPAPPFQPAVGGPASPPAAAGAPDIWSGFGASEDDEE